MKKQNIDKKNRKYVDVCMKNNEKAAKNTLKQRELSQKRSRLLFVSVINCVIAQQ